MNDASEVGPVSEEGSGKPGAVGGPIEESALNGFLMNHLGGIEVREELDAVPAKEREDIRRVTRDEEGLEEKGSDGEGEKSVWVKERDAVELRTVLLVDTRTIEVRSSLLIPAVDV